MVFQQVSELQHQVLGSVLLPPTPLGCRKALIPRLQHFLILSSLSLLILSPTSSFYTPPPFIASLHRLNLIPAVVIFGLSECQRHEPGKAGDCQL